MYVGDIKSNQFGEVSFWDEFYKRNQDSFEWLQTYEDIHDIINQYCDPEDEVLNIGCGNSELSEKMIELAGFKKIVNLDFSLECIEAMRETYEGREDLVYECMDVTSKDMAAAYEDSFDTIIDKCCLDSILCGEYSFKKCKKLIRNVAACLKKGEIYERQKVVMTDNFDQIDYIQRKEVKQRFYGGVFILVSNGVNRKDLIQKYLDEASREDKWDITQVRINKKEVEMVLKKQLEEKTEKDDLLLNFIEYERRITDLGN